MLDVLAAQTSEPQIGTSMVPHSSERLINGIAILGSHPATVTAAPFSDPSWQVWACSPHNVEHRTLPRVDAWFEVHSPYVEDETRSFQYLKAISEMPLVWMRDKRALASGLFRGAREYPEAKLKGTSSAQEIKVPTGTFRQVKSADGKVGLTEVLERRKVEVPNNDGMFCPTAFTSSIAYMLAMAIATLEEMVRAGAIPSGVQPSIGIWGVMQASETEYVYQRPGIQYFLYEAQKRGIKVVANRNSCLFDMPNWKW